MDEDELQQIRAARMRELQGQPGGGNASDGGAEQNKNEEMRASVLAQLLTQPARERLNRVRIVKPERATQAEQVLVRMAQTGQLQQRVDEPMLRTLLDRMAQQDSTSSQNIRFSRRSSSALSDDEDDVTEFSNHTKAQPAKTQANNDSDDDFFD